MTLLASLPADHGAIAELPIVLEPAPLRMATGRAATTLSWPHGGVGRFQAIMDRCPEHVAAWDLGSCETGS